MANLNGFVKIHRKFTDWGWYSDSVTKDVFLHILITAAFKSSSYLGHELKPGQAVIGRKKMADILGFSEQQIRTALKKLESTGEITLKSTNRFTIATVEKWELYQLDDVGNQPTDNQQITNKQPTDNQQITNKQPHLKNVKNVKNNKYIYGEYENVKLSAEDMEKLTKEFPEDWQSRIELLSEYMASTGKSYKNHLATIRAWSRKEKHDHAGKNTRPAEQEKAAGGKPDEYGGFFKA
ncbi:MAG: hypothetical protein ACLRWH_01360 [Emergencia sp.]